MNRGFKNYVVLIPASTEWTPEFPRQSENSVCELKLSRSPSAASDKRRPSPLRVRDDITLGQLVGRYVGEGETPYSVGCGLVMRCRTEKFGTDKPINFIATELLGINGKTVYGDAILCRFAGDYVLYEKKEARAVAEAIDLLK